MDYDTDVSTKVVRVNRTYNVYRGTSPSTQNRLEVSVVCPPSVACCCPLSSASFCKKERKKKKGKRKPPLFSWWDKQLNTTILLSLKCISSFLCCDLMHIFSFQCFLITEMKESLSFIMLDATIFFSSENHNFHIGYLWMLGKKCCFRTGFIALGRLSNRKAACSCFEEVFVLNLF